MRQGRGCGRKASPGGSLEMLGEPMYKNRSQEMGVSTDGGAVQGEDESDVGG